MYRMGQEEKDAVARVIDSKELFKVNGGNLQETANFEKEMRDYFKVDRALLMTSGTAALTSALIGMGVGPGDEVIIPAYTYIATAMSVVATGAMPIICEVDETLMMDPVDAEAKITDRTKVLLPVHMQGYPCNMDAIMAVAKKHGLLVLEDACQACGSSFHGRALGSIGDAGAFSFNFFKIISAGEGGAMLTNNQAVFEKGLIYHDASAVAYFGDQMNGFTTTPFCGTEFRTNEITAAILREQLKKLDGILADLRKNKKLLKEALGNNFDFAPSNDPEGESGAQLTLRFETKEQAKAFAEKVPGASIPAYLGKHVYYDWAPIMNKIGACHPLMDPFKFAANKAPDYSADMCAKSLEIMAKCVHIGVNPDWTPEEIQARAAELLQGI